MWGESQTNPTRYVCVYLMLLTVCCLGRMRLGDPAAFLPVLHYCMVKFSRHVASEIAAGGFEVSQNNFAMEACLFHGSVHQVLGLA